MHTNPTLETLYNRKSIRKYTNQDVSQEIIGTILEAARWAPSGLNNQPWRFCIIKNTDIKGKLAGLTTYKRIIDECNTCIAVFYNVPAGYNRDKDIMSIGACIENMLIAAESLGIGAVWLGEILNRKDQVSSLLEINSDNELMAVIALGFPDEKPHEKHRSELHSLMLKGHL